MLTANVWKISRKKFRTSPKNTNTCDVTADKVSASPKECVFVLTRQKDWVRLEADSLGMNLFPPRFVGAAGAGIFLPAFPLRIQKARKLSDKSLRAFSYTSPPNL